MKTHFSQPPLWILLARVGSISAESSLAQPPRQTAVLRAVMDLTDGSRIVGTPLEKSIPLTLAADGSWTLGCSLDSYSKTEIGWGNPYSAGNRTLASGKDFKLNTTDGNHFRIEVVGQRIAIWIDQQLIIDIRDEKMAEAVGGKNLTYGGVGIGWGWECMGWIENVSATPL